MLPKVSRSSETVLIDCDYVLPRFAGAYLIREGDEAAFIETNTAHSVPGLMEALRARGLKPEQVRWIIVTHVHLDHAGGAGALIRLCPNAKLLCHPRAARHLVDPSKLVASARQVYGDSEFERLYGELPPIEASRVQEMADGSQVTLGGTRTLTFMHTRGHANHHFCVLDSGGATGEKSVFTGDAFGLAYPALQGGGLFIIPSSSPTDFDPNEAIAAVDRIAASGAQVAYLTHFGPIRDVAAAAAQLKGHLRFMGALLDKAKTSPLGGGELAAVCRKSMRDYLEVELRKRGLGSDESAWRVLKLDCELNGDGIAWAARRLRGEFDRK